MNRMWFMSKQVLTALIHRLPTRWHALTRELAKFGTIGVVNFFVNMAVANILWATLLHSSELKAKAIATVVAATCAYFMNRHWTYRHRPKSTLRREYSLFFLFNVVGLLIEVSVVGVAKYGLHQTSLLVLNVMSVVGILLGTVFRFWAYRTHVFKVDPAAEAGALATTGTAAGTLAQRIAVDDLELESFVVANGGDVVGQRAAGTRSPANRTYRDPSREQSRRPSQTRRVSSR